MFISKFKQFGRIFFVLVLAYLISNFSTENIFLANSPKIRPNLGSYLLAKFNTVKTNVLARLNFNFNLFQSLNQQANFTAADRQTFDLLKNTLKPVTKGVNAASKDNYSYTEFNLNEIEWARVTYTLKNGQTITVEYPKGTEPPPQALFEGQKE